MPLGSLIGGAVAGLGALFGDDGRNAERENRLAFDNGQDRFDDAIAEFDRAEDLSLSDLDAADLILAGIEPAILEGLDETARIRVAQRIQFNEQENARTNSRLAASGLDSTTVGAQVQRTQARGQADATGSLAANFALARGQVIGQARNAQAANLSQRVGVRSNFASQRAGIISQQAQAFHNREFVAPNTGAAIGNIAGSAVNAFSAFGGLGNLFGGGGSAAPQLSGPVFDNDPVSSFLRLHGVNG